MKADPKMASQTTNISLNAICMFPHSVYSSFMCRSAHAPGVGRAKRLSINGFKCTECDGNLICNHMVFPKCSKWPRLKGTRFKKIILPPLKIYE